MRAEAPEAAVLDTSVPVLLLGGEANGLAVTRHLGGLGIAVRASGGPECWAMRSLHCAEALPVPPGVDAAEHWRRLLLSGDRRLDGHVVFALSDDAIAFVLAHEGALRARYRLETFDGDLRRAMLDKAATLRLAETAGVPAPAHWPVSGPEDVAAIADRLTFPVMVKPLQSHRMVAALGCKLFIVERGADEVARKVALAREHGIDVMVVEMVPGPDSALSSYYTYLDATGAPLFHYTKRVVRRQPVNRGGGVYHVSDWLPETAETGLRYLQGIGWRGLANIEFKRDPRDGQLKVIEVNTRFTAAHRLVLASGAPIDLIAYCDLTGQPAPVFTRFREGLSLHYPLRDFRAFLEMRRAGDLTLGAWLASLPVRGRLAPLFSLRDPMPALARTARSVRQVAQRIIRRGR